MPLPLDRFQTGGALQGAAAASLLRERQRLAELQPGAAVGLYRIVEELGRGGMAIVYRAERADGEYEQQVALKWMLDPQPDAESEARFRSERQALADLRHPHIARLLDGGRSSDGRPWFAMELIEGLRIDRHCETHRLERAARLRLFLQVCSAVAFAHARGVIHRDIKPSNVLVDADGSAHLLDFGIAHLLGRGQEPALHAFTPGHASPEQQRGEAPTVASDVYQLGVLLRRMFHAAPGGGEPTAAAPAETAASQPEATLPGDLEAVARRATAEAATARYPTVPALAADIEAVLARRPVSALPRRPAYLLRRFLQRHPLGSLAAVLTLVLVLGMATAFTLRLAQERDAAAYQARVATAVLDFLRGDLLAAADPAAAPGQELTVRQALDLAAASVGSRFAEAPAELATIRSTLASLYFELGRLDEAVREADLVLAAAEGLGWSIEQRWPAEQVRLRSLVELDRIEEAESSLARLAIELGPAHPLRPAYDYQSAALLHHEGHYAEAEALMRAALETGTQAATADTLAALRSQRVDSLLMLGRQQEALDEALAARSELGARLGADHPRTLLEANRAGQILRHMGRLDEAETLLRDTLARRERVLGPAHHHTLQSANELATALQDAKRYAEAEPLFRRVLDARLAQFGEAHLYTRNSMSNLGLLYSLWNRPDDAAPLFERTLAIELAEQGELHPDTLALMHNIAGLYRRQARLDEALSMHERAINGGEAALGREAWQVGMFRIGRAQTLAARGEAEAADAEFGAAIAVLEASLGTDSPRVARARELRAAARQP